MVVCAPTVNIQYSMFACDVIQGSGGCGERGKLTSTLIAAPCLIGFSLPY